MRKLVLLLLLSLVAAACSSSADSAATAALSTEPEATEQVVEPGQPAAGETTEDDAGQDDSPADATAESAATPATTTSAGGECGYNADVDPQDDSIPSVEVAQIAGDPLDPTVGSALTSRTNELFPEPLIDLDRILSGGPPPDGIPPLDNPRFHPANEVQWLQCAEPVLSLVIDGEARAYPLQIMTWHELVNDTFGDGTLPVTVSYCPLCNSSLAYDRRVGDKVMSFGTSGALFNSSLVMYDRQTESLWTHFNGTAVVGALTGTKLDLLPMQTTSWANFIDAHPDGLVLNQNTGFNRRYGENPYVGYDTVDDRPFLFDGEYDERLQAKQRVVSISDDDDSAVIVLDTLAGQGVVDVEVSAVELTVWHLPGTATALDTRAIAEGRDIGTTGVYKPVVDGQTLTFSRSDDGYFRDAETSTVWNISGQAIEGELQGAQLEPVEHLDTFWFAIAAFRPDTRIIN